MTVPIQSGIAPMSQIQANWNLLIILSGPGGVGKGTIIQKLLKQFPEMTLCPSATTRKPDPRDSPGEYDYVSAVEFADLWHQGKILESDEHLGARYGLLHPGEGALAITDIDVNGSMAFYNARLPRLLRIGVLPPGRTLRDQLAVCRQRMDGRGSDPDTIKRRLDRAEKEITTIKRYWSSHPDARIVTNGTLEDTVATCETMIRAVLR